MIVGIVVFVLGIAWAIYTASNPDYDSDDKPGYVGPIVSAVIGVVLFVASFSFVIVPTGYTGVLVTFGQVAEDPLPTGFNAITPFCSQVQLVDNKYRLFTEDDQIWAESAEQTQVYAQGTQVTYEITPEASAWIYAHVNNYEENLLTKKFVDDAIKSGTRMVNTAEVTAREVVCPAIQEALQVTVDELYGPDKIIIRNIAIGDMNFTDQYTQTLSERQQAIIQQEKQNIENQTAIDKAKAEATVKKEEAQGIAEANRIVAESITDGTLQQKIIDKWNGELPKYVGGDGGSFGIIETMQGVTQQGDSQN